MTDQYAELHRLVAAGRLSQRCPNPECGLVEAAHMYCSKCLTPTREPTWFAHKDPKIKDDYVDDVREEPPGEPDEAAE